MTLHVTYCDTCTRDIPAFLETLATIQDDHPDQLYVVNVSCMAACDVSLSLVVEEDYYLGITIREMNELLRERLSSPPSTPFFPMN